MGYAQAQVAPHRNIHRKHLISGVVVCNRVPREHKCCWHQQVQFTQERLLSGHGPVRFLLAALPVLRAGWRPSCAHRSQVQRRQARESASCALLWGAFRPSSGSQARVFVEVAEARSRARRALYGWGHVQAQDATAGTDGHPVDLWTRRAAELSRDVETTGGARARRGVLALRHARSRARRVRDQEDRHRNQVQSNA